MGAYRHVLNAFTAGEIDPLLCGRTDTEHYAYGLETCENFVAVGEGPLIKRPGFEYVCDASETASWLGTFRFSITQEYVIEWCELGARFYTNGGRIETSPGTAYEITTPYMAAHAPQLSTQQSYDRLYINHSAYPPGAIARTGAATFVHATSVLANGPFADPNTDEAKTVTASGTSGTVTLTASSPIFAATDVGALFRIEAKDFSTIKAWEPGMDAVSAGEIVRSDGKAYQALTSGKTGTVPPTHTSGAEWDGQLKKDVNDKGPYGIQWQFLHERQGIVRITAVVSATEVDATVIKRLPDQVTTVATHRWTHAAFSRTQGWPSLVTHAWGRQVHIKGLDIVASVVGDFGGGTVNFQTLTSSGITAADLGFRRTVAAEDPILWVVSDRQLLAGTATKEIAIGAINTAQAVAGDNIKADPQSFYGSEAVFPVSVGTETVFVERGGRRLRSAGYDLGRDRYVPVDLTAAARHITRGGVVQLANQRIPHSLLYAVRADGQLIVHAQTRGEIKGFSRAVLGGGARALSAVSVVGADGKTDELWLLVERQRADGLKREIWRQTPWRDLGDAPEEQFFVDCGTRYEAAAGQTAFSGLGHLAGQEISVLANGGVIPRVTVDAGGNFSLPAEAVPAVPYVLILGLPYVATVTTLRPDVKTRTGSSAGLRQRLVKLALRLLESMGLTAGAKGQPQEELIDRPTAAPMDAPIPLFSGDTRGDIDSVFDRDGQATFISARPLNAVITMAMLNIDVDGGDV